MAGAFGYGADTYQVSMEMAELSLLPAVRRADAATLIVADGTSCRHQIKDGTGRSALHVARVLAMSLDRAIPVQLPPVSQRKLSMAELTLDIARKILDAALAKGVEKKLKPLVDHHSRCARLRQSHGRAGRHQPDARPRSHTARPTVHWRWAWVRGPCSSVLRSKPISSAR